MPGIDPHTETLIPVLKASAHIPGRPHFATVWRWSTKGVRGVKLESVVVGTRRYTSEQAIQRFIEATTVAAGGQPSKVTSKQRERQIDAAEAELAALGIR